MSIIGGIAQGLGSIAGAVIGGNAAKSAAQTQANASLQASQIQAAENAQARADLWPYNATGQAGLAQAPLELYNQLSPNSAGQQYLGAATNAAQGPIWAEGALSNYYAPQVGNAVNSAVTASQNVNNMIPGQMTQAQLEQTPGYQFDLSQGLKSVQNSAAARGLGVSGAAMKGAAQYATGLAENTYENQFNIAQQRFADTQTGFQNQQALVNDYQNEFANAQTMFGNQNQLMGNQLNLANLQQAIQQNTWANTMGLASLGENAAATSGYQGMQGTNAIGNYLTSGAAAQAAGQVGAANAITNGLNGVGNSAMNYLTLSNLLTNGGFQPSVMTPNQWGYGNGYNGQYDWAAG